MANFIIKNFSQSIEKIEKQLSLSIVIATNIYMKGSFQFQSRLGEKALSTINWNTVMFTIMTMTIIVMTIIIVCSKFSLLKHIKIISI